MWQCLARWRFQTWESVNLDDFNRPAGEADPELDTQQEGAMTIAVVANPDFSIGGVTIGGKAIADFAGDAGMDHLASDLFDLGIIG
jgi:hypothetical protein